jgi:hypothetical protein
MRSKARLAGALYLIIIIGATFAEVFVRDRLVVSGDAAATASNILAHESLYRLGGAADLTAFVCDAIVALIFYELFRPVSESLSLLAAFFRLVHVAVMAVNSINHFAPLILLRAGQLPSLALAFLRLHALGYNIALVFFGCHCLLIGYLIYRSTFLPRILGALLAIAGICYLANSFTNFLAPAFAATLFPWILLPAAAAEWSLTGWLLFAAVDLQRWKEISVRGS